jgi:hypothetical protein
MHGRIGERRLIHRKMNRSESEQLDIMDKILQSPENADEVVEEGRKMMKEIKQQKKLLETLIEQKD